MAVELAGFVGLGILIAAVRGADAGAPVVNPPTTTPPARSPVVNPPTTTPPARSPAAHTRLDQFVAAWTGKFLNFDRNPYGAQCVEIPNYWCQLLGIEKFPGNAADFEFDAHPDCDYVRNTPTNYPPAGAIVIWRRGGFLHLEFGHVDVALPGATAASFYGFDQNWGLGSPCHRQWHNYVDVAGWLVPRVLGGRGAAPVAY